jgi:F-type H+-transporting ATPase subunit c
MNADAIAMIYAYTAMGVGIILAAAGLGSALGWGLICSKYLEGIARQPEMRQHS